MNQVPDFIKPQLLDIFLTCYKYHTETDSSNTDTICTFWRQEKLINIYICLIFFFWMGGGEDK